MKGERAEFVVCSQKSSSCQDISAQIGKWLIRNAVLVMGWELGWQLKFLRSGLSPLKICVTPDKPLDFSELHPLVCRIDVVQSRQVKFLWRSNEVTCVLLCWEMRKQSFYHVILIIAVRIVRFPYPGLIPIRYTWITGKNICNKM